MSYDQIPDALRALPRWVGWQLIRDGDKPRKVPINARTGEHAASDTPSTWSTFAEAASAVSARGLAGLGIMLGDGLVGVDIDHCVDTATGEVSELAAELLEAVPSYAEYSPSGTGVHILAFGTLPSGRRRAGALEMYDAGRYFTVTAEPIGGAARPVIDATDALADVHRLHMPQADAQHADASAPETPDLPDDELLAKAFAARGGSALRDLYGGRWQGTYQSQSQADLALCNALAFWCGRDLGRMDALFRRSGLYRDKWDERHGKDTYGNITLRKAADECRDVYKPRAAHAEAAALPTEADAGSPGEDVEEEQKNYSLDDTGNARRFRDTYRGSVLYDATNRCWRCWDGRRWATDTDGDVKRKADSLLDDMRDAASEAEPPENDVSDDAEDARKYIKAMRAHISKSRSSRGKEAMLREAQHLTGIPCSPDLFDKGKGLINMRNGILNLATGELTPHAKGSFMTLLGGTVYDLAATAPLWARFLDDVFLGDTELIRYAQVAVGYSMTGDTREQVMFLCLGDGNNGKSTFLEIVAELCGEYARNVQPETVMRKRTGGASSDVARLDGSRLVTMQEPDKDANLNEPLVKQLTGSATVTARYLYANEFEYTPQYKLWLATNYKPRIRGTDEGIWRRIRVLPFNASFDEAHKDRAMKQKLRRELPGILNWALDGARAWTAAAKTGKSGLPACAAVDAAVSAYRAEMDRMTAFLGDCVCEQLDTSLQAFVLYQSYKGWCAENGERYPLSSTMFGIEMTRRFKKQHTMTGTEYIGLALTYTGQQYADRSDSQRHFSGDDNLP